MIGVVAALHYEARPFIQEMSLKRDYDCPFFEIYQNTDIQLIISGVGKINSAAATAYLLSRSPFHDDTAVFNVGICGSSSRKNIQGELFLIHEILDHDTGRRYYPDMLAAHSFPESNIETFSHVVYPEHQKEITSHLIDMEASGFYQSASHFLGPHQIHILKVVSDYIGEQTLTREDVIQLVGRHTRVIGTYIDRIQKIMEYRKDLLTPEEYERISSLQQNLHLTETQKHDLLKKVRLYKLRTGSSLVLLQDFTNIQAKSKQERKVLFEKLRRTLGE